MRHVKIRPMDLRLFPLRYLGKNDVVGRKKPYSIAHIMHNHGWDFRNTEIAFQGLFHATVRRVRNKGNHTHVRRSVKFEGAFRTVHIHADTQGCLCVKPDPL